ncbi:MAG: YggN family protein [Colwellia sp.]|nr:YggN family protein [Colwellia sp.]
MKKILATVLLVATSSVYAHDSSFSNDSCNVELNGGIKINKDFIEFFKKDSSLYKITDNETLTINGQVVSLSASQQSLITEYSTSIRAVLPEMKNIAIDAISLATDGVNLAFNELLGEGNDVGAEITGHLNEIKTEIDNKFAVNKEFYIDENGFSGAEFFGEDFEKRMESAIEETIKNSMGSLLIAVGQEMLFAGGNMDAFETRMENFGQKIEHEMEARGEQIEMSAEALCHSAIAIDGLEEQLKSNIVELASFDILTASNEHSKNET